MRGPGGRGWRWRWRGPKPDWLDSLHLLDIGDLGDVPGIGGCIVAVVAVPLLVLAVIFLPFIALGLLEALLLGVIALALAAAATLLGRPILIRAERTPDVMRVWAVRGWRESKRVRDRIVEALRAGTDPDIAAGVPSVELASGG